MYVPCTNTRDTRTGSSSAWVISYFTPCWSVRLQCTGEWSAKGRAEKDDSNRPRHSRRTLTSLHPFPTPSFTTAVVCIIIILAGLLGTLALLSVYKQALPALPFSIFFGVTFYLITRSLTEPWFQQVLQAPMYL